MIRRALERRDGLPSSVRQWRQIIGVGLPTNAGPRVNEQTALAHSAVFACIGLLSRTLAAMPIQVRRRLPDGRGSERATEDPRYSVLARRANERQTRFQAIQFLTGSYFLRGNGLAWKRYRPGGALEGYYPLRWDHITPEVEGGELVFDWRPSGAPGRRFRRSEVVHVHGLSTDGVVGLSPIAVQREAIGSGLAMQEYNARLFSNSATPAGVLTTPATLGNDEETRRGALERLRTQWDQAHGGLDAAHRVAILEEGMKWEAIGLDPQDAQFLEGFRFNRSEVAGWFGVPLHLIGDRDRGDVSIDTLSREFVYYHLLPHLVNLELQLGRDLFSEAERELLYVKINPTALLRGSPEERAKFYNAGITGGWLVRNEARDFEDLNPLEGLDEPLAPLNMSRVDPETGEVAPMILPGSFAGAPTPIPGAPPAQRAARDRDARARQAAHYQPLFEDLLRRLLRSELRDLEKLTTAHFGPAEGDQRQAPDVKLFLAAVERFHDPEGAWRRWALSQVRPVTDALGRSIFDLAAAEVEAETDRAGLDAFLAGLAAAFGTRYALASLRSLENGIEAAAGRPPGDAAREVFEVWREVRPLRAARKETIFQSRAAAREAYLRSGITKLRWRVRGSDNCPFCLQLDGAVVAIEGGTFAGAGQRLEAEGRPVLVPKLPIFHPPLHKGCVCDIEAAG